MSKTCPDCSKSGLTNLGMHIAQTECEFPELSEHHVNILNGLLMGDAHIRPDGIFEVAVKSREYLESVVQELPDWLITSSGVHSLYNSSTRGELMWRFRTVSCEQTKNMREKWYSGKSKEYPKSEISLNPTTLKHWYATDGGLDGMGRPCLYTSNEDTTEIRDWLSESGYDVCRDKHSIRFNKSGGNKLISEIEDIRGYQYKLFNPEEPDKKGGTPIDER